MVNIRLMDAQMQMWLVMLILESPYQDTWLLIQGEQFHHAIKLQKYVALSTTKAEYIAFIERGKELLWMKFLHELGLVQENFMLYCDSQGAIYLNKRPIFHSQSKHIEVRYQWKCVKYYHQASTKRECWFL